MGFKVSSAREKLEVDILFVGAGPACLSGALHLKNLLEKHNRRVPSAEKLKISIAIIEKGKDVGAHILSGAVLDPIALRELIPDYEQTDVPLDSPVSEDMIYYLTGQKHFRLPFIPPSISNYGNFIISLNRFVQWLGKRVEANGIDLFLGFSGTKLLFEGNHLIGVRTGDKGIGRDKKPGPSYEPGVDILAKAVVLGEGVHGSLTKQAIKHFNLDQGKFPQIYSIGVKEVWDLPSTSDIPGQVIHTLGYPLKHEEFGGGFIYSMERRLSLGLVIGLNYKDPFLDPHKELQRLKTHPLIASRLKGATLAHYGAKALPEGGYYSLPKSYFNGGLIIGDSGGLVNSMRLKGIHLAMKSGMLAAETLLHSLLEQDFSERTLGLYSSLFESSWAAHELYKVRNFHQGFENGLLMGMLNTGLQMLTGGRGWKDPLGHYQGHVKMRKLSQYPNNRSVRDDSIKNDGEKTFDKVTNVYFSGTKHEENQPSHLLIADPQICQERCTQEFGNPCQYFCPANVYEIVSDNNDGKKVLHLNPSNCLHCKTCEIMDPYQIITWVPPEGGGGPNYINL